MRQFITLFILIILYSRTYAQNTIVFKKGQELTTLADKSQVLIDSSGNMKIEDILKAENQQKFFPNYAGQLLVTIPSKVLWVKLKVKQELNQSIWADIFGNLLWELDIYKVNDKNEAIQILHSGLARPYPNKPKTSSHYIIPLLEYDQTKTQTFYLRIHTKRANVYIPKIGVREEIIPIARFYDYRVNLFLGLMLVMVLYNAFIGYITKDRLYLYYVIYLMYIGFLIPVTSGDLPLHILWIVDNLPFYFLLGYLVPMLFAFRYLEARKNAKKLSNFIAIVTAILTFLSFLHLFRIIEYHQYDEYAYLFTLIYNTSLWILGIYLWSRGNQNAKFYTIAWTSVLVVMIWTSLIMLKIIPYTEYLIDVFYIAFGAETVLFSLALGNRMNVLQKEKQAFQQKNLRLVEEQKETLEKKVKERTQELQEANEELQVMNEELHQSQEELASQRDFLDTQNTKLNFQQKKIQSSIKSAQSIQQAMLPYQEKLDALLKDYFILNRPKDVVSGDFYWLNKIEDTILFIVADCTGHGVSGAFMTLIGSNLLDKIIRIRKITDPAQILTLLHEEIHILLRQEETNNHSGMDAVVISLKQKAEDYKLTFSGAKNELWYFTPDNDEIKILKGTRKSIGGYQNTNKAFENTVVTLPKNSLLYTGSDGLQDQNNEKRISFGKERLKHLIIGIKDLNLREQKDQIEQTLNNYMQNTEQRDDILCIGFRV